MYLGSRAVDRERFLQSNASSILGTLTKLNLKYVPGIEEAFNWRNLLPSTALDPVIIMFCMIWLGRNIEENQHVKMGAYHTIDLELNRKFTLTKAHWDSVHIDRNV